MKHFTNLRDYNNMLIKPVDRSFNLHKLSPLGIMYYSSYIDAKC